MTNVDELLNFHDSVLKEILFAVIHCPSIISQLPSNGPPAVIHWQLENIAHRIDAVFITTRAERACLILIATVARQEPVSKEIQRQVALMKWVMSALCADLGRPSYNWSAQRKG